jgi:hypothetical protein
MHYTPNWSLWNMIPTQISVHTHLPISKIFKLSSMAPLSSNRNLRLLSMVMVRARHHCHFWYFLPTQCYITTNLCKLTTYQIPKEIYNAILITIATCSSTWSLTHIPGLYLQHQASAQICWTYQQPSSHLLYCIFSASAVL